MSGTGFLDDFVPTTGNYEPPTQEEKPKKKGKKGKKKAAASPTPPDPPKQTEAPPLDDGDEPQDDTPIPTHLNANPAIARMIDAARVRPVVEAEPPVLCGIAGPPLSGKTGGVLDSLTEQEIVNGAEIHHLDFDMGGATTRAAHHADKAENIVVLNPWVVSFDEGSRESYDFPATFQLTIDILKAAVAQAEYQTAYKEEHGALPQPYLKTFVFDGADSWLHICETLMKIEDLELGHDGIDAAAFLRQREKGGEKKKSVSRFNWNLRTIRYQIAMHLLRELCRHGVHCYFITHTTPDYDSNGNEILGSAIPKWLKNTEGQLQQFVMTEIEEERNDEGELTGVVKAYGVLLSNRTSLDSPERWLIFERNNEGGKWYGWPGIAEGRFGFHNGGDE